MSRSLSLVQTIAAQLTKSGVETDCINLLDYGLPMFDCSVCRAADGQPTCRTRL